MVITRANAGCVNFGFRESLERAPIAIASAGLLLSAGLSLALTVPSRANDCLSGYRALAGVQDLLVREHICTLDGGSDNILRVAFARLDEVLAGNLARNEKTPELEQLFPKAHLVDNEVSSELKVLFQYAHRTTVPARNMELTVSVSAPHGDTLDDRSAKLSPLDAGENETRRLWSISSGWQSARWQSAQNYSISSGAVDEAIYNTTGWPNGFKLFYSCQVDAIQCTELWRYVAQVSELDAFERDSDRAVAAAKTAADRKQDASRDKSDWDEDSKYVYKTHFALFRHLAQGGWPDHFLVIHWNMQDCGGAWNSEYLMPSLALDVAIVENGSSEPIEIQDIVGAMDTATGLRSAPGPADTVGPLHVGETQVAPGERIIIPVRITFIGGARFGDMSEAEKMYRRISSKPPKTIFTLTNKQKRPWITYRKVASSYRRPELPENAEYRFGPQLRLSGFRIQNQDLKLNKTTPNLISLGNTAGLLTSEDKQTNDTTDTQTQDTAQTADAAGQVPDLELHLHTTIEPEGSCPILYVWDEVAGEWVNRGKVIHEAKGEDNEATSLVPVGPGARRFRLAEEEPEVASMRRAQLVLTLRDGRRVAIGPDQNQGATFPRKILAYTNTSFTYSVPKAYSEVGIAKAELAVTGFYTRNSAILASQLVKPDLHSRGQRP
jgi:hypothetical protein